jgi:hypothetical protein
MLSGWYVDILVVYLFRVAVRFFKARGSVGWIVCNATVTGSGYLFNTCDVVEITYLYTVDDEPFTGISQEPFLSSALAKRQVAWFPAGSTIVVRVNPAAHETSIVREADQSYTTRHNEIMA